MSPDDPAEELFQQAVRLHQAGRLDEAEALYRRVLAADPGHLGALRQLAALATHFGWHDAAADFLKQALDLHPGLADLHNQLGQVLRRDGAIEASVRSFERALDLQPGQAETAANLAAARQDLMLSRDPDYAVLPESPWTPEAGLWDEIHGNSTLFVLFAGLGIGQSPPAFIFRKFLATYGEIDKLFVRDLSFSWYYRGIPGASSDVESTAQYLGRRVAGYKRTVFIGCSAGATAAVLYGELLGVDKVIAFAPQVLLSDRKPRELLDDRWERRLTKLRLEVGSTRYLDLANLEPLKVPVDVYYPVGVSLDCAHAERLSGRAVALMPQPGESHLIALDMRDRGLLRPIIERELPGSPRRTGVDV